MRSHLASCALLVGGASAAKYWVNDYEAYQSGAYGASPNVTFRSTSLVQPLFQLSRDPALSGLAGGYIIMDPAVGAQDAGPMIVRGSDFSLVYAGPRAAGAADSNVQRVGGRWCLTTFAESAGSNTHSHGLVYGEAYGPRPLWTTDTVAARPVESDAHELFVTRDGTAVVTAYVPKQGWDLTGRDGGADATLLDSCFEEVDFRRNASVFYWCASDHFSPDLSLAYANNSNAEGLGSWCELGDVCGLTSSSSTLSSKSTAASSGSNGTDTGSDAGSDAYGGFDAYHINSVEKTEAGNYLVSLRLLALVTLIDGRTGAPIWRLSWQAALNDFTDLSGGVATNFSYQHHARFHRGETQLSLLDNHADNSSRGLLFALDQDARTVAVLAEAYQPDGRHAGAMGSLVVLPDGGLFAGYGVVPSFAEYSPASELLTAGYFAPLSPGVENYRYFWVPASDWVGRPATAPDLAVLDGVVYASWNGATEVAEWAVYAAAAASEEGDGDFDLIVAAPRDGFETEIDISGRNVTGSVYVQALSSGGAVLGRSASVSV
ncbi:ASST-domain-containing protein [Xylariaceae sp. FL0804]|nr:ASST-domain-containing protein [Xylariaceae sp. FL0804]